MYTDSFWDTVRGHQLADTLIRKLPKLADKPGHQYTMRLRLSGVQEWIEERLSEGELFVDSIALDESHVLVIMEKF